MEELAELLGFNVKLIWKLTASGAIPFYKAGRLGRYDLTAVKAAMYRKAKN